MRSRTTRTTSVSDGGRVQKSTQSSDTETEQVEEATSSGTSDETRELLDDVDDLLDEIDDVLEENAEEFVKNYVQKGGQ